jgi:hypothetical protein
MVDFMRPNKAKSKVLYAVAISMPLSGLNTTDFQASQQAQVQWKNNPFVQQTEGLGVHSLNLFAIVHGKNNAAALINDQIVKTGDKIGTAEIVSIEKQHVVLRNENGIFKLLFKSKKNEKP